MSLWDGQYQNVVQEAGITSRSRLVLLSLFFFLSGCGVIGGLFGHVEPIDAAISQIDKTTKAIVGESSGWRDELPKLVDDLNGIESRASADVKDILTGETNEIRDLTNQAIAFGDAKAQNLIAQAGAEYRCNAIFTGDFVKQGVVKELQSIQDHLKFWKANNSKPPKAEMPPHAVCWINPSSLSLYPSGGNFLIDTSNIPGRIMYVFGYDFRSDALPTLELHDASGKKLREINVKANYNTRFEINLDFANETFSGVTDGSTAVFNWPDRAEENSVNLILSPPAKLTITNPVLSDASPQALTESVTLRVTITNTGGRTSGGVVVRWSPDPNDRASLSVIVGALQPKESKDVDLPAYVYKRAGALPGVVALDNGDDSKPVSITVRSLLYSTGSATESDCCGGSGGSNEERSLCGSVANGILGAAHTNVDRLGLLCAELLPTGSLGAVTETAAHGGDGGDQFRILCDSNQLLVGLFGQNSGILERIGAVCAAIPDIVARNGKTVKSELRGGDNGGPFEARCPDGSAISGIRLKWGARVDHVWMECVPIARQ